MEFELLMLKVLVGPALKIRKYCDWQIENNSFDLSTMKTYLWTSRHISRLTSFGNIGIEKKMVAILKNSRNKYICLYNVNSLGRKKLYK